ncbi:uncharacterized protein [Magallana gigas]|uniref:uncharacterized protein isoform X7 n=1 Tax=Magallana gigas TaxID=29159 RepID=UPI0009752041|eukprot:XP_019930042.1 PREDICTED: uncharacterized protein LOC105346164 isoform X6 [Crassostrea gigas]
MQRPERHGTPRNVVWLDTSNLDIVLRRRRTPRHFSGRYPSDVYQTNDYDDGMMYPPANEGPYSGRYTPMKEGRGTPLRRSNTVVLGSRPSSRINLGTQDNVQRYGDYLRPTDSRLFYPDINNRLQTPAPPTPQPIRRERTFGGFSQSDNDMDPFTKQYYTRMWKQNMSPENMNLYRMGRAGGRWRHITSCTASSGSHLAFVEGTVKQVDNRLVMPRAIEPAKIPVPQTINRVHSSKKNKLNTTYNQHAKNGFKYWYQEQNKPMDLASRFRLKARLLERGVW